MKESVATDILDSIQNRFRLFESQINGEKQTPFHESRKAACSQLMKNGLPDRKSEAYKYTQIGKLLAREFDNLSIAKDNDRSYQLELLPKEVAGSAYIFVNGFYKKNHSHTKSISGIKIKRLGEGDTPIAHAKITSGTDSDPFDLLNHSFTQGGISVEVDDNADIEDPIILINFTDSSRTQVLSCPKHQVIIGKDARVSIVEFFISSGERKSFANSSMKLILQANAVVELVKIGIDDDNIVRVDNTSVHQLAHSKFHSVTYNANGSIIRNNLNIYLEGEYCETNLFGLYLAGGNSHIDNHTTIDHLKPNSQSTELYKGILSDKATGVFNGKIYVRPDAQNTKAFQSNKNILLSDDATINTKPQLEIWANDVKCTHGCTTGQLDEEQLFYLRSRGIGIDKARSLLLKAFAEEVIMNISSKKIMKHVASLMEERINDR